MPVTHANLDEVFRYHAPKGDEPDKYEAINKAAKELAAVILNCTMPCADQQAALRLVREARMTANAAVALRGLV